MTPFLQPRLVGRRFDRHTIPLEFLRDLAALEEMLVDVAKVEFLRANPNRQRSPRRFNDGVSLNLTAVTEGSAVPVIGIEFAEDSLFPAANHVYFERARDAMIRAIGAAAADQKITEYLPQKILGYFDRFGRSLRADEAVEFDAPDGESPVRLTREIRRKLLFASQVKELTDEVEIRGEVPEADQDDMTFELQMLDGKKVKAPLEPQYLDTVLEAFNAYQSGLRVALRGIGRVNRNGKLVSIESVDEVNVLDPLDVGARLGELGLLTDGWLEGQGVAPKRTGLDWFLDQYNQKYSDELPLPHVYPTPNGGIRLEWLHAQTDASLDVDLTGHRGAWHEVNIATDAEAERALNLDSGEDWTWLCDRLRATSGATA